MKRLFSIDSTVLGRGSVTYSWQPDGNYLAVCGATRVVQILDRKGQVVTQFPIQGASCLALDWDKDGEMLAVLSAGSGIITLWNSNTRKSEQLDTNMKDLSFLKWSRVGPQLAVGTAKGNLLLYNRRTSKKIPILGKHTKKITCGAWNLENNLALGSEDKQVSISDADGQTIQPSVTLKFEPSDLVFSEMKEDARAANRESTISVNLSRKTLMLYNMNDPDKPIELAFQPRYGGIVSYSWFGDGYILLGFQAGYMAVISTHIKEIGQEVCSLRAHRESLSDIVYSAVLQKGATIGDNCVKVFEMSDLASVSDSRSEKVELDNEFNSLEHVSWTNDGQILTVSSKNGNLYTFLTKIPVIHDGHESRILYMTSLRELCCKDTISNTIVAKISIDVEPSFACLGPDHAAVGMNNRVWFYKLAAESELLYTREYLGTIEYVKMSREYAAVFSEGRVVLHLIDNSDAASESQSRVQKTFPEKEDDHDITSVSMTSDFLIYSTSRGTIHYFSLEDWCFVNEFRFEFGIRSVYPNSIGTRLVFIDETNGAHLYNPVNDHAIEIPGFSSSAEKVLWDLADWGVFYCIDSKSISPFIYAPHSLQGPRVLPVCNRNPAVEFRSEPGEDGPSRGAARRAKGGSMQLHTFLILSSEALGGQQHVTDRPFGFIPVVAHNGAISCQMQSGALASITLHSHSLLDKSNNSSRLSSHDAIGNAFAQSLELLRFKDSWEFALKADSAGLFRALSVRALECLDIGMAIRCQRHLGNAAIVMALEDISRIEERNLLLGHVCMLFGRFGEAQDYFLQSSRPQAALDMRRDLMHWDHALKLAESLAPSQIPFISREYAQQLEFKGESQAALEMYDKAVGMYRSRPSGPDEHYDSCIAGIARTTIRSGDLRRGFTRAAQSGSKQLCKECAQILEEMKQWNDAAVLYEKAELFERAASIYITQAKNLGAAAALMSKISTPKLHLAFAKAKEGESNFAEAEAAYEHAKDMDAVIRLNLEKLGNPQKAFDIVRESKSPDGAAMCARFCQTKGEFRLAIEFLHIAKKPDEAYEIAQSHDEMEAYAEAIGDSGTPEVYQKIAQFYETRGDFARAGEFNFNSGQYNKALKLFLQCGDKMINRAIDVVGKARSEMLTHTLIDFLMGEADGNPKDLNYIFRLYMALGKFGEAAKTAVIIGRQEQDLGNYKVAHKTLLDTHRDLEAHKIHVPQDLRRSLTLLHSYIVVRILVKMGDHRSAARMLVRVAKNISKFPEHIVPILTSTVIECHRADMLRSAFEYASVLVRPEYRAQIAEPYKRKIESIVRKRKEGEEDPEEPATPCPYCNAPLSESQLDCTECKNTIPYCVATGRHMCLADWSQCPTCRFPALYSVFVPLVSSEKACPMCEAELQPSAIVRCDLETARQHLRKYSESASSLSPIVAQAGPK